MNTEEFKDKNDGMHLIVGTSYSLQTLQEYIKNSSLSDRCGFLDNFKDVEEVKIAISINVHTFVFIFILYNLFSNRFVKNSSIY